MSKTPGAALPLCSCVSHLSSWGLLVADKIAPTLQIRARNIFLKDLQRTAELLWPQVLAKPEEVTVSAAELKGKVGFGGVPEQKMTRSIVSSLHPHPVEAPQGEGGCRCFKSPPLPVLIPVPKSCSPSLITSWGRAPGGAPSCVWLGTSFGTAVSS